MKANGIREKWMDEVNHPGMMIAIMRENIQKTRSMALGYIIMGMESFIEGNGKMVNSMARVSLPLKMVKKRQGNGLKESINHDFHLYRNKVFTL